MLWYILWLVNYENSFSLRTCSWLHDPHVGLVNFLDVSVSASISPNFFLDVVKLLFKPLVFVGENEGLWNEVKVGLGVPLLHFYYVLGQTIFPGQFET